MELKDVILGFLDWKPMTGYELKKMFEELDFLPWSGNNNQIYKALLELDREGLVSKTIVQQESLPAQKRYSVTRAGQSQLQYAVIQPPESEDLELRNRFLLQLAWTQCLSAVEVRQLVLMYQKKIENELKMNTEQLKRKKVEVHRTQREEFIWNMIFRNRTVHLQSELSWLNMLLNGLTELGAKDGRGVIV